MKDDLISRSAAIDAIHDYEVENLSLSESAHLAGMSATLRRLPAVDAAPVVHAQWDAQGWEDDVTGKWHRCGYRCSYCGQHSAIKWPGCPWCRSMMDGEKREAARA